MTAEPLLHREFHLLGRFVWTAVTVAAVGLAVATWDGLPMTAWRGWVGFGSLLLLIAGFVAYGIYQVNCITLTPTRLRVGREVLERADIDFQFGVQPPLVLSPTEQDRVEEEWPELGS